MWDSIGFIFVSFQAITMLCVLKGSYRFFSKLVDELSMARHGCASGILVEFIHVSSYADTESTGIVEINGLSNLKDLNGRNILVFQ